MKEVIVEILDKKKHDLTSRIWDLASAESVFFGEESPTPFEVWQAAGEYILKHGGQTRVNYVRKVLRRSSAPNTARRGPGRKPGIILSLL